VSACAADGRSADLEFGPGETGVGALDDEVTLELCDGAEDVHHQPPGRRRRVDAVRERAKADPAAVV
jgi:hypothetical protein